MRSGDAQGRLLPCRRLAFDPNPKKQTSCLLHRPTAETLPWTRRSTRRSPSSVPRPPNTPTRSTRCGFRSRIRVRPRTRAPAHDRAKRAFSKLLHAASDMWASAFCLLRRLPPSNGLTSGEGWRTRQDQTSSSCMAHLMLCRTRPLPAVSRSPGRPSKVSAQQMLLAAVAGRALLLRGAPEAALGAGVRSTGGAPVLGAVVRNETPGDGTCTPAQSSADRVCTWRTWSLLRVHQCCPHNPYRWIFLVREHFLCEPQVHDLCRIINTRVIESNDAFEENNGAINHRHQELCCSVMVSNPQWPAGQP